MSGTLLKVLIMSSMAVAAPVHAQDDLGNIVSGIAQALITQEQDRSTYLEAQRRNSVSAYRNYLTKFPKGAYRLNAERALTKLGDTINPGDTLPIIRNSQSAASNEASVGLSRSQRIQIQKQLNSIGYPTGLADGLWGANTRKAIARWQAANRITATGYVTAQQVRLIAQQAGPDLGSDSQAPNINDDQIEERLLSLTSGERREVQRRLSLLGYGSGVDGSFGPRTRRALASWQRDEGLRASGYLTADQLRSLYRDTGG